MECNDAEREAIGLCIAMEAVDDITNHALLELRDVASFPGECEVYFQSHIHEQLFLIRLLDFAREKGDETLTGVSGPCLQVLEAACKTRAFDSEGSVEALAAATRALSAWLHAVTPFTLGLPSLDLDANLEIPRLDYLYVVGNQSKHNLSRLTGVSNRIQRILADHGDHGYKVSIAQVPLALEDFREHLQKDYFVYYGTWLAELLNNIRWGLQEYLLPTFRASYTPDPEEDGRYAYRYPENIRADAAQAWFWRLMNNVRRSSTRGFFSRTRFRRRRRSQFSTRPPTSHAVLNS
jgi:hypothetical protein